VDARRDALTQSIRHLSWRRSSCSTCTWLESAVWRSARVSTSQTDRSRSGSKTEGWS